MRENYGVLGGPCSYHRKAWPGPSRHAGPKEKKIRYSKCQDICLTRLESSSLIGFFGAPGTATHSASPVFAASLAAAAAPSPAHRRLPICGDKAMWNLMRIAATTLRLEARGYHAAPGNGSPTGLYGFHHLKTAGGFHRFVDEAIER